MALSIHTNYSALLTQTNINKTSSLLASSQQRLSTGLRINSAADDAAGLQIATRLEAQERGMGVAMRNIKDATGLLQTAEGAMNEMTDIVQRMKDLSTQGANGTNSTKDLEALQSEYNELGKELANIVKNTKYAGEALFSDGTKTDGTGGKLGAAVNFQIGASAGEGLSLDVSTDLTDLGTALDAISDTYTASGAAGAEIGSNATAKANITLADTALEAIGTLRASLGANINRLAHTSNNLANMRDNTSLAMGNIMDADFAAESAKMTKNSMLMQSGISMLKQAGQMPSLVMSLLG